MSTSKNFVSRLASGLLLGALLALNACSVGTITASSRVAGGGGGGGGGMGIGSGPQPSSPANVETARIEAPVREHGTSGGREPLQFRLDKDCWACR